MFGYWFGYDSFDTLIFIRKLYSKIVSVWTAFEKKVNGNNYRMFYDFNSLRTKSSLLYSYYLVIVEIYFSGWSCKENTIRYNLRPGLTIIDNYLL